MGQEERHAWDQQLRLLQLRELAPEEFISFLIEVIGLVLIRRRAHRTLCKRHQHRPQA